MPYWLNFQVLFLLQQVSQKNNTKNDASEESEVAQLKQRVHFQVRGFTAHALLCWGRKSDLWFESPDFTFQYLNSILKLKKTDLC